MLSIEKAAWPYVLLLDPVTNCAAAYSNTHELMTRVASAELVSFALAHEARRAPWDESINKQPTGRELPDWATPEVRSRCVLLCIQRGGQSDDWYRSMPKR